MSIKVFVLFGALVLASCVESQVSEGTWIDQENEKVLLNIIKENGKFWLDLNGRKAEIEVDGSEVYSKFRDEKAPIIIDANAATLTYLGVDYIPLSKSMKGQFTGTWKNETEEAVFLVQIDENVDLNWDFLKGTDEPIRYYPKRTATGFHFTVGQVMVSYKIVEGFLIDNKGIKYSKVTKLN